MALAASSLASILQVTYAAVYMSITFFCPLLQQDHAAVAVVDLYGGRLVSNSQAAAAGPSTPSGGGGGVTPLRRAAAQATQAASGVRHKECTVHHVDPQLYQSRPGLLVYQVWRFVREYHL